MSGWLSGADASCRGAILSRPSGEGAAPRQVRGPDPFDSAQGHPEPVERMSLSNGQDCAPTATAEAWRISIARRRRDFGGHPSLQPLYRKLRLPVFEGWPCQPSTYVPATAGTTADAVASRNAGAKAGGAGGARTHNPRFRRPMLYPLSYRPVTFPSAQPEVSPIPQAGIWRPRPWTGPASPASATARATEPGKPRRTQRLAKRKFLPEGTDRFFTGGRRGRTEDRS